MEHPNYAEIDESHYRREVLQLPSEEAETAQEQKLIDEARQLGLNVPEVELVASLTASIASGMVDLSSSSPIISSTRSSTDRNSAYDITPSHQTTAIDLLDTNLAAGAPPSNRHSMISVIPSDKKERRKSTLKSAMEKIHFRKKRSPSAVLLPPAAQITIAKGSKGIEQVRVESKPSESQEARSSGDGSGVLRIEIPAFDHESLQRSQNDEQLRLMRERQVMELNRHNLFQDAFTMRLRQTQQSIVAERLAANKDLEAQKREKNINDAARMEERQLTIEMDQMREFERAKMNSRTRIKHMEGYFNNSSPPPSPGGAGSGPETTPARKFTAQHKAQLAQEYHDHKSMDQLHEAKIKVLRDRQELRLQEAIARMERELDELIDKHAIEFAQMQQAHQQEEMAVVQAFDAKKARLIHRWNLEEAILRTKLGTQHGKVYGPLPPLSFSDPNYETRDSAICVAEQTGAASA